LYPGIGEGYFGGFLTFPLPIHSWSFTLYITLLPIGFGGFQPDTHSGR
jgi:hypothetical protein